ncbi:hypothetical protein CgunFtcFv8_014591 [Champsocephalus gunnari]|uniref:Uncharacterized protein n=1 Tax=Champsocephalus gunnari TaxID=52237 RepID=A0AAN8E876_CHAGU|nr:hypothetical protein CgunFtcFv8_014591 [Champsocephalus gunnari]
MLLMALNVCWTAALTNRKPTILGCSGVLYGTKSKQSMGLGEEYKEQAEMTKYLEERVQSRLVVDNGVKSVLPFPGVHCHTRKRQFVCALMSWPGCGASSKEASWSPDWM